MKLKLDKNKKILFLVILKVIFTNSKIAITPKTIMLYTRIKFELKNKKIKLSKNTEVNTLCFKF